MVKRGKTIQINLSNRLLYTFIAIGILLIAGIGVYALTPGTAPNPGHLISELAPPNPCATNEFLQFDGTNWICAVASAGSVDWSSITSRPAGLDDGDQIGITSETDPTVKSWAKDNNPIIPVGGRVNLLAYTRYTTDSCNKVCITDYGASTGYCLASWRKDTRKILCSTGAIGKRYIICLCAHEI